MTKSLIAVILRMLIPWLRQQDEGLLKILRKIAKAVLDATSLPEAAAMAAESLETEDQSFEGEAMDLSAPDPLGWARTALAECEHHTVTYLNAYSSYTMAQKVIDHGLEIARLSNGDQSEPAVDQSGRPTGVHGEVALLAVRCLASLSPRCEGHRVLVAARDYLHHGGFDDQP